MDEKKEDLIPPLDFKSVWRDFKIAWPIILVCGIAIFGINLMTIKNINQTMAMTEGYEYVAVQDLPDGCEDYKKVSMYGKELYYVVNIECLISPA